MLLTRSAREPIRALSREERWTGPDRGIIWCWERGREMAAEGAVYPGRHRNPEHAAPEPIPLDDDTDQSSEDLADVTDRLRREPCADKARRGELCQLPWQGGAALTATSKTVKIGSLEYLAMWQGLRGDDLVIDTCAKTVLVCSRTGAKVKFRARPEQLAQFGRPISPSGSAISPEPEDPNERVVSSGSLLPE